MQHFMKEQILKQKKTIKLLNKIFQKKLTAN